MQICKAVIIKKDEKWWVWWWFYFFNKTDERWTGLRELVLGQGQRSEVRGARSWLSWMPGQHRHLEVTSWPLSLTGHCWQLSPAGQRHKQLLGRETDVRLHQWDKHSTLGGRKRNTSRRTEIQVQLLRGPAKAQSTTLSSARWINLLRGINTKRGYLEQGFSTGGLWPKSGSQLLFFLKRF